MVNFPSKLNKVRGIGLLELMIASLMISMVFLGTTSIYLSALRFTSNMVTGTKALSPIVSLEEITKKIGVANLCTISNGNKSLDLRGDFLAANSWGDAGRSTPSDPSDDSWLHYRICAGDLRYVYDPNPANSVDCVNSPVLLANVDGNNSTFLPLSPSPGNYNVIQIHVVTTGNPVSTVETAASLSARTRA